MLVSTETARVLIVSSIVTVMIVTFGIAVGDIVSDRARALHGIVQRLARRTLAFLTDQGYALAADIRRLSAASRARSDRRAVVDRVRDYGL